MLVFAGEGFPRADIDVYSIRKMRNQLSCLHNDHKALMAKLQEVLESVHAATASDPRAAAPAAASRPPAVSAPIPVIVDYGEPIVLASAVSAGSPAAVGGLLSGDAILAFGSATSLNGSTMTTISDVVRRSVGTPIPVVVRRPGVDGNVSLTVTPGTWDGRGLLGVHLLPPT